MFWEGKWKGKGERGGGYANLCVCGGIELRIHPEIERGDNESIKNPNTGVVSPRVKCCSEK